MSNLHRKPGIMLVHPRLHTPSPAHSAAFLRWTKLHFRDMLNMPCDPDLGSMTRCIRYVARDGNGDGEDDGNEYGYLYTLLVDDIGILKSQAYYAIKRALNLEGTRELGEGEEGVELREENKEGDREGRERMIFDLVDARFAIFEEVKSGRSGEARPIASYQHLSLSHTSTAGSKPSAPHSFLVGLNVNIPLGTPSPEDILHMLQSSMVECFDAAPGVCKLYSSVYRWAGVDSQPEDHPMIDLEERVEWLVTLLVVDGEGGLLKRVDVEAVVRKWVDGVGKEGGLTVEVVVWKGEVFMS